MGHPLFYLQIVDREGRIAHLPGGGALEADLIKLCQDSILSKEIGIELDKCVGAITTKGVGFLRTQAHVEEVLRVELSKILIDHAQTLKSAINAGLTDALMSLKKQTIHLV